MMQRVPWRMLRINDDDDDDLVLRAGLLQVVYARTLASLIYSHELSLSFVAALF